MGRCLAMEYISDLTKASSINRQAKRAPPIGNLILNLAFSKSEGLFFIGPGDQILNFLC
jgi:hypothetical protein